MVWLVVSYIISDNNSSLFFSSSLVWAAGRKHSGVVQRLLTAGARPNSCDKYATSALTWAARAGDVTACAALLRAGADANTAGMYCWTPLLQATHGKRYSIKQFSTDDRTFHVVLSPRVKFKFVTETDDAKLEADFWVGSSLIPIDTLRRLIN